MRLLDKRCRRSFPPVCGVRSVTGFVNWIRLIVVAVVRGMISETVTSRARYRATLLRAADAGTERLRHALFRTGDTSSRRALGADFRRNLWSRAREADVNACSTHGTVLSFGTTAKNFQASRA